MTARPDLVFSVIDPPTLRWADEGGWSTSRTPEVTVPTCSLRMPRAGTLLDGTTGRHSLCLLPPNALKATRRED